MFGETEMLPVWTHCGKCINVPFSALMLEPVMFDGFNIGLSHNVLHFMVNNISYN